MSTNSDVLPPAGPRSAPHSGAPAEALSAEFLEKLGCRIVARNFRTRTGEIDIVASLGDTLLLVEVKHRANERFAPVEESLTATKRKRLLRAGRAAAAQFGAGKNIRFDLIALVGQLDRPEVRHYPDVLNGFDL